MVAWSFNIHSRVMEIMTVCVCVCVCVCAVLYEISLYLFSLSV